MSPANLLHLPRDLQPSKQVQTITSTAAGAGGREWRIYSMWRPQQLGTTPSHVGYRHAIFQTENPGSRECRGFLLGALKGSESAPEQIYYLPPQRNTCPRSW